MEEGGLVTSNYHFQVSQPGKCTLVCIAKFKGTVSWDRFWQYWQKFTDVGLKGTVSRDFLLLVLFLNQFPPSLWLYHYGRFEFFRKFAEIFAAQCLPLLSRHWWQMEKTFKQKNFNNFVWTPLGSRVNIYINFCLQYHFKVSAAWYCCHYLPPVSLPPVANFPPVSLIPVAICHRRRWHRWQICRQYRWHR